MATTPSLASVQNKLFFFWRPSILILYSYFYAKYRTAVKTHIFSMIVVQVSRLKYRIFIAILKLDYKINATHSVAPMQEMLS